MKFNTKKAKILNDKQMEEIENFLLKNQNERAKKYQDTFDFILDNVSANALADFDRQFPQNRSETK